MSKWENYILLQKYHEYCGSRQTVYRVFCKILTEWLTECIQIDQRCDVGYETVYYGYLHCYIVVK
jgi:hypothetical protein